MKRLSRFLAAAQCLLALSAAAAASPPAEFYRVSASASEMPLAGLSNEGWLSWSNTPVGTSYVIERARRLVNPVWEPVSRGVTSNGIATVKVMQPPPAVGGCAAHSCSGEALQVDCNDPEDPQVPGCMRLIPGGTFTMGDILGDLNNATPVHTVWLSPFLIQAHEVTVAQYAAALQWAYERSLVEVSGDGKEVLDRKGTNLMELGKHNSQIVFGAAGFTVKAGQGAFPAPYVSWYGAVSCCNWLSEMEGFEPCYDLSVWTCDFSRSGYRLPTEAEWEFAARSGYEGMRFPWSDTNVITHSRANYKAGPKPGEELAPPYDASPTLGLHPDYANNKPPSSPVGAFAPNNYGLVDMCGNVWEWVWDWSARYLPGHQVNPVGPETGTHAIFRGGSWQTTAERETVASRYRSAGRAAMIEDVGFRVVMSLREAPPGAAPSP